MRWISLALLLVVWCLESVAVAQDTDEGDDSKSESPVAPDPDESAPASDAAEPTSSPEPPPPASTQDKKLEEAKTLFRKGNALRETGDCQQAIGYYLKSRALVPSAPNTLNAAYCLNEVGRFDEALEMFEAVLLEFSKELPPQTREQLAPTLQALRNKTASVEVGANVDGVVVIDGRQRGTLPLPGPVRVLPGTHRIRVAKDGYQAFETEVSLEAKQTKRVDATLKRLTSAGRLRVESENGEGAELFVDGASVGTLPWEGSLAAGKHIYFIQQGDKGSAPRQAMVVQGQMALARTRLEPLGPLVRISVRPSAAELRLNDVPMGSNSWQGRLPIGEHVMAADEEGYLPGSEHITIGKDSPGEITLRLEVDRAHPLWQVSDPLRFSVELFGGYGLAASLGSGAEESCDANHCIASASAKGPLMGARGGLHFPFGLAVELAGGYLNLSTELTRGIGKDFRNTQGAAPIPVSYEYTDSIELAGGFVGAGVSYHVELGEIVQLGARAHLGAMFVVVVDDVEATITGGGESVDAYVENAGSATRSTALFIAPELFASLVLGNFRVGAGAMALFVPGEADPNDHGETIAQTTTACDPSLPTLPLACIQGSDAVAAERAFGPFTALVPNLHIGYVF